MREKSPPFVRKIVCGLALSFRRKNIHLSLETFEFFFNVHTYNSEFIVAPISRNSTDKYPSLTLKSPQNSTPYIFLAQRRLMMPIH
jgi:hypothetical protein